MVSKHIGADSRYSDDHLSDIWLFAAFYFYPNFDR
jgi:hypothetical protein